MSGCMDIWVHAWMYVRSGSYVCMHVCMHAVIVHITQFDSSKAPCRFGLCGCETWMKVAPRVTWKTSLRSPSDGDATLLHEAVFALP